VNSWARLVVTIAIAAFAWPIAAQVTPQAPPAAPQQAAQTFRSNADVVEVDASVFDKNGKTVTTLTAADFVLRENGAPQHIQTVYLVSGDPAIFSRAPAEVDGVSLPRHIELKQRVFVFVLDLAHLSNAGFVRSRKAIQSFLQDGATPADVLGIVVNGQMLNNRLDTDKAALQKALSNVPAPKSSRFDLMREWPKLIDEGEATRIAHGDDTLLDEVVRRACLERPDECGGRSGTEVVQRQIESKAREIAAEAGADARATLQAMQALASGLTRFPGTKQVAIFSEGFFADELVGSIHNLVGMAAQNGVRFSTLDARGLTSGPSSMDFTGASPSPTGMGANMDTDSDVLSSLALDTGGRFVQRFNDLRPSLDAIERDSSTYYLLAYSPATPFDGSYRTIDVAVTKPGVTVRARRGYVATPRPLTTASTTAPAVSSGSALPKAADSAVSTTGTATAPAPAVPAPAPASPAAGVPAPAPAPAALGSSVVPAPAGTPASPARASAPASTSAPAPVPAPVRLRPGGSDHVAALESSEAAGSSADAINLAREGWALYGRGDAEHARDRLAASVATKSAPLWAVYALGLAEFALTHYDRAAEAWEQVRRVRPDYEPVYLDLADAYLSLGRLTDTLTVLRNAAGRWPNEASPHDAIGVVLVRRDDLDGAIKEFELATQAAPGDGLGFYNLGRAYQMRYERLQRNVSSPNTATGTVTIGDRDRQKAIDAYNRYLQIGGPFERQAKDALAILQWKDPLGDWRIAELSN
jgi:VWFA-related protein